MRRAARADLALKFEALAHAHDGHSVIADGSGHENCIAHSMKFLTNPQRQVILVSRDPDNTPWVKRFGSFLRPDTPQLGQERNITDPASGSLHLGYQNLLGIFRRSATPAALEGGISAEFAA